MAVLRFGVAGASRGNTIIHYLKAMPDTDVVAVMDPDEQALRACADEHGVVHRFTDYTALLDHGVDAVYLASPMPFHAPQAVEALARGIHVLSEVTAAVDLDQCRALLRAAHSSRARYMMAENYVFIRSNLLVRELVRRGFFGEIYFAEGEYIHNVQALHRDRFGRPTWRVRWQVGRKGVTYGTHSLGPILTWLDDRVAEVQCVGTGVHTVPEYVTDDTTLMVARTTKGVLARVRLDMVSWRPHLMNYYSLQGTEGCYEAPRTPDEYKGHRVWFKGRSQNPEQWQSLWDYADLLPAVYREVPDYARSAGHWGADYWMLRAFVDAVREGQEPPLGVDWAVNVTLPGLIAERSYVDGGRAVRVPTIEELLADAPSATD